MGTRGAYGFHKGGRDKITYNHFDSLSDRLCADVADSSRITPTRN